ncbi:CDP-diacylglycerol--glycerol-3-phosphate 3-phosphatidyltransferase [uncultured Bifidobacterium sp.]|uniref:CDP-diacylglycerol--glycerol-3-phosphate 3-phosphatidyltransferase n=1 Tax=uncultured Bifidobacterium sp. TaxID=165187 RepID=UPI00261DF574|nr:CDP-diacylglycerol--glycerol-3-phosphate 3-phosphatidyltransferase [uncultured Bifidobacterium sp.]
MRKAHDTERRLLDGWNSPPNLVTYTRILLVIVFIVIDVMAGPWGVSNVRLRWAAAILFIVAASTDKLDGWMARSHNQVTELGKLLDPIADKLLIGSALVVASVFGEIYWWVTVLMLVREIGITVMRFFVIDTGGRVIAASSAGKYKTLAQCVGLGLILLPAWSLAPSWQSSPMWLDVYYVAAYTVVYLSLILCLYSGALYVLGVVRARRSRMSRGSEDGSDE